MQDLHWLALTELRKYFRVWWSYRVNALSWIVLWGIAFPLLMTTFDNVAGDYGLEKRQASLIGFIIWDVCMAVLAAATQFVSSEAREGTLEHIVLSPVSPLIIFSLRIMASFLVLGVQTFLLGIILVVVLRVPLAISGPALIVLIFTLMGVGGVSLALGGLALIYKSTNSIVNVVSLLALLFTGALVPLNNLGIVFEYLKYLMPTTWGIDVLRRTILYDETWATLANDGTWLGLSIQATIFILFGGIIFNYCLQKARLQGSLASY